MLVSLAVADASRGMGILFAGIGPVELKGAMGRTNLLRAHLG